MKYNFAHSKIENVFSKKNLQFTFTQTKRFNAGQKFNQIISSQVISLSKRMKIKPKEEKPDYIKWKQFFMAVAMLSKTKQGRHERRPKSTVR